MHMQICCEFGNFCYMSRVIITNSKLPKQLITLIIEFREVMVLGNSLRDLFMRNTDDCT